MHLLTRPVEPTNILTDLTDFLKNVTSHFFNQNNNHVHYLMQLPKDNIQVNIDPILLQQALLNILSNAIDAVADGGDIRILLKTEKGKWKSTGEIVLLIVEDSGCGMSNEIKEKMFFPMVTGRAEGTGLGLSIAQSLIQQHNGLIECESEPGRTVFSILLPIDEV